MSIVALLEKQNLIAQKNNLQYQLLQNSSAQRSMLNYSPVSFGGNLNAVYGAENALNMDNISIETNLAAISAELSALNNSTINYLA